MSLFKEKAKNLLRYWVPNLADSIQTWRADGLIQRKRQESGLADLEARFMALYGTTIRSGPFAGMNYIPEAKGSVLIPKLLGTYETELGPWITNELAAKPKRVIDIGCAEGYYAVGLARCLPGAEIFAFDINSSAQSLCRSLAERNGVAGRVHVAGRCSAEDLQRLAGPGTVVICDIEGAEGSLLDPAVTPALRETTLLVELHDCLVPGVSGIVRSRFSAIHQMHEVHAVERNHLWPNDLPGFTVEEQALMLSEHRVPGQSWIRLRPLNPAL
jgi:Methyltransferase domain